jgi:hypothetical protein
MEPIDPDRYEGGDESADKAAPRRGDELLHQWQVDAVEAADPEANEEAEDRQKDPAMVRGQGENTGSEGKIENRADEYRPPTYAISQPSPNYRTQDGAYTRRQQNDRRLAEAQLPRPDNEGEDEADQEIVEELQHIAEDCGYDDPPLVGSQ